MVYMSVILYIECNMEISDHSPNYTLTSEGTRDVIRRAKEAGLNISAITSQLQGALAAQQNEANTFNDLVNTYQKLFDAMKSIMLPFDVRVEVGSISGTPVFLDQEELYRVDSSKWYPFDFREAPAYLHHPMVIEIDSVKTDWVEQELVQ
jgi:hypothetical protein